MTRHAYVTIYEPVQVSFSAEPTGGAAPLEVQFTNLSSGDYTNILCSLETG